MGEARQKEEEEFGGRIAFAISAEDAAKLERLAKQRRTTLSQLCRYIVGEYLDRIPADAQ